jgi:hypothetical protein
MVWAFKALKSMTSRSSVLRGFGTGKEGALHGDARGSTSPAARISSTSKMTKALCAGLSLNGGRATG